MNRLILLIFVLGVISPAIGEVFTDVYLADSNTPLQLADFGDPNQVYQDVMVGTKLKIIVSSDANEYWGDGYGNDGGGLAIEEVYWDYGDLAGRDFNEITFDYEGSHFDAAGVEALVVDWTEPGIEGFDLYTGSTGIEMGEWFIVDYNATGIGTCNVGFYDHRISWFDPNYYLVFRHVRTRDFNNDTIVNLPDFAIFASYWQQINCSEPNWCEGTDLDMDTRVDVNDLILFGEYWLVRTE